MKISSDYPGISKCDLLGPAYALKSQHALRRFPMPIYVAVYACTYSVSPLPFFGEEQCRVSLGREKERPSETLNIVGALQILLSPGCQIAAPIGWGLAARSLFP